MSRVRSPFSSQLIMSNLSSILTAFCHFFTWIALGEVDLVGKANVLEEKNYMS